MTPEEKSLLERTYRLSEENNKILKSMRRSQRVASVMRFIYWIAIIALTIAGYFFVQNYIESIIGAFTGGDAEATKNLFEQYRGFFQ